MKIALFSDIHANLEALEACLEHAHTRGVNQVAFLGDLVGYGGNPCEVVDLVREAQGEGAWVLKGNHDEMAVHPPAVSDKTMGAMTAQWMHDTLGAERCRYLDALPMSKTVDHLILVHASAQDPERWRYVDNERNAQGCLDAAKAMGKRHVLVGHVHEQGLYYPGSTGGLMRFVPTPFVAVPAPSHRTWVGTVGSVGQPRDGDARAMYAIYDASMQRITFYRVPYDVEAAASAIREAGLPEILASRLEKGR